MSTTEQQPRPAPQFVQDGAILALWPLGLDTLEIARKLNVRECEIANRLARLRDAGAV